MKPMPYRQIHMDFHTSPLIPDIGSEFNEDEFGKTLINARVQHINLFAKCHHGWFYYPSRIGEMHPKLGFDLLSAQIGACRKYGISYSIYTCVGWNEECANRHPAWLEISPDGIPGYKRPFMRDYYEWQTLCINNADYRRLIKDELKEEYELFKPLGFWIDIIQPHECVCPSCRDKAGKLGLDIDSGNARKRLARMSQIDYMRDIYEYLMSLDSDLQVYFNGFAYACDLADDPEISNRNKREYVTFMDIESLPSPEWGYSHFPMSVNYVNKYKTHDIIMMNGKFHLAWGDFGSLRNKAALEYECFRAAANGAGVCVGDQLHPCGKLDKCVYERIGEVFSELERTEKWCRTSEKLAEIGVYGTVRSGQAILAGEDMSLEGAYRLLTENRYQFDILDLTDSTDGYKLLILPDNVYLRQAAAEKIDRYVQSGGRLLVTGFSGIGLDCMPVKFEGEGDTKPRYMDIRGGAFKNIPEMKTIAYSGGAKVTAKRGVQVLCETVNSYFDRSDAHFCSHRQTPPMPSTDGEPCIVTDGRVTYVSNLLFRDIAEYGMKVYKDILADLIGRLLPEPLVKCDLPTYAEVYVRRLGSSYVVHILNYIVQRKCRELDTVEDVVPLYDRTVSVYTGNCPRAVIQQPSGEEMPFDYDGAYTQLHIQRIDGRILIEIKM